ncbi:sensor domain-containing diguanylate cyclase [Planococcus shixiaomingii]|uniref:sensor domain-containing diguanylate cyclase n=1 Tax=Planococcus shixiaomingii TaxID=3058393 RepID=UPI0026363982|nr:sensor domain-containing diguanylate cyclase [Planococcus sp. N022]WKA54737.1 sensor domain-containing diguanylate cyclase [Planococcus sp. N022]
MKRLFNTRKVNLATLLTFLVSASVILTLLILTISTYHSNKESLMTTYLSLNYSKAEKMSNSVESLFGSMRTNLESTVDFLEEHEEMSDQEIHEQLELLRKSSSYFNSLSWVDETGLVRTISPVSIGLKGTKITSGVTKDVLDAKKPMLTTPYIGPSNRLLVLMSQPIFSKDGTYRGIISGSIYLQEQNALNHILGNDAAEKNGSYYFVVGPEGTLLFHPERKLIGENVYKNPVVQKLTHGKSGMELVTNTKGIPMLAAYSYVPEAGWGVVQQIPYSYVHSLLVDQLQNLLVNVLLPFLILLLLSIFIARKLAKPFIYLADLANRLAEGKDVSQSLKNTLRQSHWNREADLLTKSFAHALELLEKNTEKLTQSALTDSLTGLPNRRKLEEILNTWSSDGRHFSLLVLDIDHFKSINDTYGHQMGDETLKTLAETIQAITRNNDYCFRYGGEEFVLLLDTNAAGAYKVAEKIRQKIEKTMVIPGRTITVSLGISEFPKHTNSVQELFELADKALYESKLGGRNRITISPAPQPEIQYGIYKSN